MANPRLQVDILANTKQFEDGIKDVQTRLKSLGQSLGNIGKTLTVAATLPLVGVGTAAIKMASDAEESLNKVRVAFGDSAGEVEKFASTTLESFGIARASALEMASLFGDMGTSMGLTTRDAANMSTELVGLAGDLASFKNINIDQAMTALAGVFTGETESLKRLGVVMTEVNLSAFALSQGITKNIQDMTQAEKVNLRFAYIMESTKNAQGDFARTSEGAANQTRIFSESLKELGDQFGQIMLPAFTDAITKVNGFLKQLGNLDTETKKNIIGLGLFTAALGPLAIAMSAVITAFINLNKYAKIAFATLRAHPIILVGAALAGLTVQALKTASAFKSFGDQVKTAIETSGADMTIDQITDLIVKQSQELENLKNNFRGTTADAVTAYQGQKAELEKNLDILIKIRDQKAFEGLSKSIDDAKNSTQALNRELTKTIIGPAAVQTASILPDFKVPIGHAILFKDELAGMTEAQQRVFILNEQMIGGFQRVGGELANVGIAAAAGLQPLQESIVYIGDLAMEFTDGFANGLANVIVYGEKLGDMLKNLAKQMIASGIFKLISAFFTGGLSLGGEVVGGFLGKGGGLFGRIMSDIAGSAAGAPVMGAMPAMAGANVNVGGEFTVKGTDLVMVLNRTTSKTLR